MDNYANFTVYIMEGGDSIMDMKTINIATGIITALSIGVSMAASVLGAKKQDLTIKEEVAKAIAEIKGN